MKLKLDEPFASLWAGQDAFVAVEQLWGEVYRELEARRALHRGGWARLFCENSSWCWLGRNL